MSYDIFFRGEALEGASLISVKAHIGKLFKADEAKLAHLFSGKVIALKKQLSKEDALKYQQLFKKAGAKIYIKASQVETPKQAQQTPTAPASTTKAEPKAAPADSNTTQTATSAMSILPAGSDVLNDDEKTSIDAVDVDTSGISLGDDNTPLEAPKPETTNAPDVSHLSAADVGSDMQDSYTETPELEVSLDHLNLAETGSDMQDNYQEIAELNIDLSHLDVAEAGTDIPQIKSNEEAVNPDISNLKLEP